VGVLVEDARGNIQISYSGSVTVALASDPGASILGGSLTVMARNGVAAFTGLTIDNAGAEYQLLVTAGGSVASLTSTFNVTPAAASRLVVLTQPPIRVGVSQPFGLALAIEDSFGNVETDEAGSVTVALAGSSGRSILAGNLTVTFRNGVAAFSNLTVGRIGRVYALKATVGDGLIRTKSIPFSVITSLQKSAKKAVPLLHPQPTVKLTAPVHRMKRHAQA
jgi:hypothetical protein